MTYFTIGKAVLPHQDWASETQRRHHHRRRGQPTCAMRTHARKLKGLVPFGGGAVTTFQCNWTAAAIHAAFLLARVVVRQNKSRGRWTLPGQFYSTGTELGAFRDVARQLSRDLLGGDLEAAPLGYLQCSHRGVFAGRPFGWDWGEVCFGAGWAGS